MSNENKEVTTELKSQPPVEQEVASPAAVKPESDAAQIDYQKEWEALLEENSRLSKDRDNYRTGLLRAKGKLPDEESVDVDPEDEAKIVKVVSKILESSQAESNRRKQDELVKQLIKQNEELRVAVQNRAQLQPSGNSPTPSAAKEAPQDTFWTQDQLAYFKKRGLDPEKVREKLNK